MVLVLIFNGAGYVISQVFFPPGVTTVLLLAAVAAFAASWLILKSERVGGILAAVVLTFGVAVTALLATEAFTEAFSPACAGSFGPIGPCSFDWNLFGTDGTAMIIGAVAVLLLAVNAAALVMLKKNEKNLV